MVAVGYPDASEPASGPLERCGIVDRNEAQVSLRQPPLEEQQSVAFRRRRNRPEDLAQAIAELVTVRRHGVILRRGIGQLVACRTAVPRRRQSASRQIAAALRIPEMEAAGPIALVGARPRAKKG